MLLLCGFVMVVDLSLYISYLHTVLQMLCHIRLHVRILSAICLDHLEAMALSAPISYFIFSSGCCRYPIDLWAFYGPYFLIETHYLQWVDIFGYLFNLFNGVYPHLPHFQLNATQYHYNLAGFIALPGTWIPLC